MVLTEPRQTAGPGGTNSVLPLRRHPYTLCSLVICLRSIDTAYTADAPLQTSLGANPKPGSLQYKSPVAGSYRQRCNAHLSLHASLVSTPSGENKARERQPNYARSMSRGSCSELHGAAHLLRVQRP